MKNTDYHDWVCFAQDDFESAEFMLKNGKPPMHVIFLSHQSVEKYLKALILFKNKDFSYTHQLTSLIPQCELGKSTEIQLYNACIVLDELYPFARYPTVENALNSKDSKNAVVAARKAKEIISAYLSLSR